jgi:hypothetical protein
MTREQQRLLDYLEHMMQAIERIRRYTDPLDEVAFLKNELVQDAVIRNLEILGEASTISRSSIPNSLRNIRNYRWHLPIKCVTPSPTATSKSTTRLYGKLSIRIFPCSMSRCGVSMFDHRGGAIDG